MVVLSAAVLTKSGKCTDVQHTIIETEHVRYVYQPLEGLYIVLITNKTSNIVEDLDTLRLMAKLVPEYCGGLHEEAVRTNGIELISAFDEVVALGYKESVTVQQVKTFTEMDSHEEKLQKIIMDSKMNEARDMMRRKAEEIDRQKAEVRRQIGTMPGATMGSRGSGMGSDSSYGGSSYEPSPSYGGADRDSQRQKREADDNARRAAERKAPSKAGPPSRGMQLSKAKKADDFVTQFSKEERAAGVPVGAPGAAGRAAISPSAAVAAVANKVQLMVEEKVVVSLERDGTVKSFEAKGTMKVAIYDPDDAKITIKTSGLSKEYKAALNPKINKGLWDREGVLQLQDPTKPFPVGSDNAPVILKWRLVSTDESLPPFVLSLWPNTEDGESVVSVSITQQDSVRLTLRDIRISIPCGEAPDMRQIDGDFTYDNKQRKLYWAVAEMSEEHPEHKLEFAVPEADEDAFYPITVTFTSEDSYAALKVESLTHTELNKPVDFQQRTSLGVEKYTIE